MSNSTRLVGGIVREWNKTEQLTSTRAEGVRLHIQRTNCRVRNRKDCSPCRVTIDLQWIRFRYVDDGESSAYVPISARLETKLTFVENNQMIVVNYE
jgi:hypothetical protein